MVRVWTGPKKTAAFDSGHEVFQLKFMDNLLVTSSPHLHEQPLGIRVGVACTISFSLTHFYSPPPFSSSCGKLRIGCQYLLAPLPSHKNFLGIFSLSLSLAYLFSSTLCREDGGVDYLAFNGATLVSDCKLGDVHIYDVETGKASSTIKRLQPEITAFHACLQGMLCPVV